MKGHVFMSETVRGTGQKSQESGSQSVPGTQGTTQAHTPTGLTLLGEVRPSHPTDGEPRDWWVPVQIDGTRWAFDIMAPPSYGKERTEALARLIAAAPDLLARLKVMLVEHHGNVCGCRYCLADLALIAKAEGR
jgi:hypothetical protein